MLWTLQTTQPIAIRCWDDECVLYDADTGNTFLVTPFAAEVASRLQQVPASLPALMACFSDNCAPLSRAELQVQLEAVLGQLEQISLAVRSPQ